MVRLTPKPFKRQVDPLAAPTVSGIGGASIVGDASPTASALAFDDSRGASAPGAGQFTIASSPAPIPTSPSTTTSDTTTELPPTQTPESTTSSISTTTVVGACVGAFAGAVFLVLLGLWLYKRSTQALKARARAPLTSISRNARGDLDRSRSHRRGDPWNKLESGDQDKWEGMAEQKPVEDKSTEGGAPIEKISMFKKRSPSVRTAVTTKSVEDLPLPVFDRMHPYGNVPALPNSLGKQSPPHLGNLDTGGAINWSSAEDGSVFTLRSDSFDINTARALSPNVNPARPTPPTTAASSLHRWESAEVVTYGGANPFNDDEPEPRRSLHNPFFSAHDFDEAKVKAQAKAARSKAKADTSPSANPFDNPTITIADSSPTHSSPLTRHTAEDSISSQQSDNERAILSIIAALDSDATPSITPEPRVVSTLSTGTGFSVVDSYSAVSGEEDVTDAFPLPPHAQGAKS